MYSFIINCLKGGTAEINDADTGRKILAWDADSEDWVKVGLMKVVRFHHALSTINMKEFVNYCG